MDIFTVSVKQINGDKAYSRKKKGCNGDGPFVSVPLFSLWLLTGHGRLEIEGIEGIESIE